MQTLGSILTTIERCSAISFADHKIISLFDAQAEFYIPDVVNALGDCLWHAVDIDTGRLRQNITYEGGCGMCHDCVLFFTNEARDCTIMGLPEVGVAIQFAMKREAMLLDESEAVEPEKYQYYLDWHKDGASKSAWTQFLDEWKALPETFA